MTTNLQFNTFSPEFKTEEINSYRLKVVHLSEALKEDPSNFSCAALLNMTLNRLEMLLTA